MSEKLLKMRKWVTQISLVGITRLIKLFSLIVPYRLGVGTGGMLGFVAYYLLPKERSRAISHLTQVYAEKDRLWIHHTARRCFIHLGKSLLEIMLITPRRLDQIIEFRGEETLVDAISIGRGVIYVTGHIGNWELMADAVAARYSLSVIAAPIEPAQVNDMIVGLRAGMGVRTILRTRPGASRELVRVFKENRIMGILIDQDTDVESVFIDFMGRPARTPTAAVSMALKFNSPLVFGHIERRSNTRHVITVEGPLALVRTGDHEKDIVENTAMLTKKMEDIIQKEPGAMGLDAPAVEETALSILNIPNLLSISRILSVPVFIVLMLDPSPIRSLAAAIVFAIASATDGLDGYLARKWGQVTKAGKLLDPIADKILIMSALVILVDIQSDVVHAWIAIVLIGREFAVTGLRAIASSDGIVIPAERVGKYKVGAQITTVLSILSYQFWNFEWMKLLGVTALWLALFLAVYSAIHYFRVYWKRLN